MEQVNDVTVRFERDEEIDREQLKVALPATIIVGLISPKEFGGERRTELTFEEATGEHIEKINKAGNERAQHEVAMRVIGECCGLGPNEVKVLGGRDIARLSDVLGYFLGSESAPTDSARR